MRLTGNNRLLAACAFSVLALPSISGAGCHSRAAPRGAAETGGAQIVRIEVGQDGFRPSSIEVRPGQKLTLELLRTTDATCATKVVFPDEKIERELPLGIPVRLEIATDRARTLGFQYGMGMLRGAVVVR